MNTIELLEPRIAPALVLPGVTKGVLLIQDDATGVAEQIVVEQTGAGDFTVTDMANGGVAHPFTGVKSIVVQLGALGQKIDLEFSPDGLAGSLDISTATSMGTAVAIGLTSADGSSGAIAGKVKIHGGDGDETVTIDGGLALAAPMTFDGGKGIDAFKPNGAFLAKKLTLDSVENITTQSANNPVTIGGMLVENDNANAPVIFVLSPVAAITGALTYCGSATVTDNVTLDGQFLGAVKLMLLDGTNNVTTAGTFASGLAVTGGKDADTIDFHMVSTNIVDNTKPPFVSANVAGTVSLKLGNGANTVTLEDGSFFAKDVSVVTGTGVDTVNFEQFMALKNVTLSLGNGDNTLNALTTVLIGNNFKYIGGADADTVDINQIIAGNINVVLGNGANMVTGSARITGKTASFTGGSGVDTIDIGLASTRGALTAKLGAGADSFTFEGGSLASAKLDGGKDSDTFAGQALLPAVKKLTGFETLS